jgi:hypothetical protein
MQKRQPDRAAFFAFTDKSYAIRCTRFSRILRLGADFPAKMRQKRNIRPASRIYDKRLKDKENSLTAEKGSGIFHQS